MNNEEISVSENGEFRRTISLSPDRNILTVKAIQGSKEKTIKRKFEIKYL